MKKEELFQLMGEVNQEKVAAAAWEPVRKNVSGWVKWGGVAACLVVTVCAVLWTLPNQSRPQGATSENPVVTDPPGGEESAAPSQLYLSMENIFVNEVTGFLDAARKWYDPEKYDTVEWDHHDIVDYYGTDLTPAYIPQGLTASPSNNTATVFKEKGGEVVEDTVWMGFFQDYEEDGSPQSTETVTACQRLVMTASKIGLLNDCIYLLPENEVQLSYINHVAVTFGYRYMPYGPYDPDTHQPSGYYDMYVAEFEVHGISYEIVAEQLELKELVKVVSSILYGKEVAVEP